MSKIWSCKKGATLVTGKESTGPTCRGSDKIASKEAKHRFWGSFSATFCLLIMAVQISGVAS